MHACFELPGRIDLSARRPSCGATPDCVVVRTNASRVPDPIACSLVRCRRDA